MSSIRYQPAAARISTDCGEANERESTMNYAILFPGQGAQEVGMCADARAAFPDLCGAPARAVLGWDLDSLISNGPEEILIETQHAQPALYAVSYALWKEFSSNVSVDPSAAAGHSLGEYTALAAASGLGYLDGLGLVARRGEAMATAARIEESGMAALLGADLALAETVVAARASEGGNLTIANMNAPGQIVVAGDMDDLDWLESNVRELGVRRAIRLKVAGAFHSPFMASAAGELSEALEGITFSSTSFDVYANVSGKPTTDPSGTLLAQLTAPVRFAETLGNIASTGVDTFVHIGPGDVTAGLVKRTVEGADVKVVSSMDQARAVAKELSVD
jgi:[acyl-carrier-protein] S-malonyltransferase